jgi:hypothetical protein
MSEQNKRNFFRLLYPLEVMPTIVISENEYSVRELSEQGISIFNTSRWKFRVGDEVSAELVFAHGESEQVSGEVIRIDHKSFVIGRVEGISLKRIVSEQRKLMNHYPIVKNELQS